ncbi:MAG: hypothetical protein FRX48_02171 [Lasallia pustulata]|uniref:Uncharacterized protein n=1 Tax=Lasallia pustulata TaxID=136370 RepID=A0A5M8PXI8_9LECA|nr:MAG: hypothetical protein FRX48_02171 [Lasallia pustulata]
MLIVLAIATAIALSSHLHQATAHSPHAIRSLDNIYKHHGYVDHHLRRNADAILNHVLYHGRNVVPSPSPSPSPQTPATSSNPFSPITPTAITATAPQGWENQTQAACQTALSAYVDTTNPSGMALCYNIPYFNPATGAFDADLRLYLVSPPSGDWASLTPQAISVGLSYPGGALAPNTRTPAQPPIATPSHPPSPSAGLGRRAAAAPQLLQVLDFAGTVDGAVLRANPTEQDYRFLLLPRVSLSALSRSAAPIRTALDPAAAAFVNGVFAAPLSTARSALLASAGGSIPFVLPGTRLGVFPTGLVVTGAWAVLLGVVVGYGTVGRRRAREEFRRRVRRGNMGVVKTI